MSKTEKAIFAAGCFWGVETQFRKIAGVQDVVVGYCGGIVSYPTYRQVCSGTTGHAEAAQVTYDPDLVSYENLLEAFFGMHDPTQLNRQGPDIGPQYRSALFPLSEEQKEKAEAHLKALAEKDVYGAPVATTIETASHLWPAEDYHQNYLAKNPGRRCY